MIKLLFSAFSVFGVSILFVLACYSIS
jgi:hypothetical protein